MSLSERPIHPSPWEVQLAGDITVRRYADMVSGEEHRGVAGLIRKRFEERYLEPMLDNPNRHGFAILAVCCLMVEALESFRNGWKDTRERGRSEAAFCGFFQRHDEFKELRPVAHDFYRAVRCGILHQAETTDGWRVDQREGQLFAENAGARWVSASEFGVRLKIVLERYESELINADWLATIWVNARKKLQAICRNCGLPDSDVAKLA